MISMARNNGRFEGAVLKRLRNLLRRVPRCHAFDFDVLARSYILLADPRTKIRYYISRSTDPVSDVKVITSIALETVALGSKVGLTPHRNFQIWRLLYI